MKVELSHSIYICTYHHNDWLVKLIINYIIELRHLTPKCSETNSSLSHHFYSDKVYNIILITTFSHISLALCVYVCIYMCLSS
uniref:Ovule protein n=1 Tax=Schistosoma mansoni TaxID=6183 RepID=A0A5K4F823_SCHMA